MGNKQNFFELFMQGNNFDISNISKTYYTGI